MISRRLTLFLAAIGLVAFMAVAKPSGAATIITVTATGTVTDASDVALIGTTASLSQSFVVTPGSLFPDASFGVGAFETLSLDVTLGGSPYSFDTSGGAAAFGVYFLQRLDIGGGTPAAIGAQTTIEVAPGVLIFAQAAISSLVDDFVDPTDLLQTFTFLSIPGSADASFGASAEDADGNSLGFFLAERVDTFTVTVERDIAIPAPAGLLLFVGGIAGLAMARRRRRR
jgi:hypothetical protein